MSKARELTEALEKGTWRNGKGKACCPAHDDKNPSLSISEKNGKILYHCLAGCTQEAVTEAFKAKGLWQYIGREPHQRREGKTGNEPKLKQKQAKQYETINAAAKQCTPPGFSLTEIYRYPKGGQDFAAVVRYDNAEGKTFRQFKQEAGKWEARGAVGKWPLYKETDLPPEGTIFLTEGEKCQRAAAELGLDATCTAGGAKAFDKTDYTPLTGRDVVILPDNDKPGRNYANEVARILTTLDRPARVRILNLPDLPEGGDIADWIEAGGIRERFDELLKGAQEWKPPEGKEETEAHRLKAKIIEIFQHKGTAEEHRKKIEECTIDWLHEQGKFYYHREDRSFLATMFFNSKTKQLNHIESDYFMAWLSKQTGLNIENNYFKFIHAACKTEALQGNTTGTTPAHYWTATEGAIYISNGGSSIVKITADRLEKVDNGQDGVLFLEHQALRPWELTDPTNPFDTCRLFNDMATTQAHGRLLFALWACTLPSDLENKPPLCLTAEHGAGKTAVARGLFLLYGIPERIGIALKNGDRDFWTSIDKGGLYCIDNADTTIPWLPDVLSSAATGGILEPRKLYTDKETVILKARAWITITSLNPTFASDVALADRLIVVRLKRREGATAERALFDEIKRGRNAGLSFVCHTLQKALADTEPTPAELNARHPDFAELAVRIGRAWEKEAAAIRALQAAEQDKSRFNLENDPLGIAVSELVNKEGSFKGTAAELGEKLKECEGALEGWKPVKVAKRLNALLPHFGTVMRATKEQDSHTRLHTYTFEPFT